MAFYHIQKSNLHTLAYTILHDLTLTSPSGLNFWPQLELFLNQLNSNFNYFFFACSSYLKSLNTGSPPHLLFLGYLSH